MSVQELTDLIGNQLTQKLGADAEFEVIHQRGHLVMRTNDQVFVIDVTPVQTVEDRASAKAYMNQNRS